MNALYDHPATVRDLGYGPLSQQSRRRNGRGSSRTRPRLLDLVKKVDEAAR